MRSSLRAFSFVLSVMAGLASIAQSEEPRRSRPPGRIDEKELLSTNTEVPGMGHGIPGIDLSEESSARYWAGDTDTLWTDRDLDVHEWAQAEQLDSVSSVPARFYWARYELHVDSDLKGVPLLLNIAAPEAIDVFVNGRKLFQAEGSNDLQGRTSPACATFPLALLGDGRTEVIALRIHHGESGPVPPGSLRVTLHSADVDDLVQQKALHYGVFVGINFIILMLGGIMWSLDRRDRSWLLLALLSLATAFVAFAEVGSELDLGLSATVHTILTHARLALGFLPLFLLIMWLRHLLGKDGRRGTRLSIICLVIITCFLVLLSLTGGDFGSGDLVLDASFPETNVLLVISLLLLVLAFVVALIIFVIQVVRLGFRVLRTKGFVRWIGAGALVSGLVAVFLEVVSGTLGMPQTSWLSTLSDYCTYIAIPVSVVISMSIRSAQQNRIVMRQRDDLDREVHERTAELRQERDRSDELLLNILPHEVAEELKRTGAAAAKHFDQASVLFTDFKGFTAMSEQVGAEELLQELNTCFKAFDDIIGKRGIEKIKTIGDAYMCVGGLPDPASSSPVDVVLAALEMQAFMEHRRSEREVSGQLAFAMRVGIHSGPVVAGIVGVKKFQYDIWGDTVNTASRMESSGEVGQVNISGSTHALVKDEPRLAFTPRGKVQAKGKGEMEMYYVRMLA